MTRTRAIGALIVLLLGAAVVYAQEPRQFLQPVEVHRGRLFTGAGVAFQMEGTTNDAFEFTILIEPTEDVTWILPAAAGTSGQQLQTDGAAGVQTLSWASAGSQRAMKNVDGPMRPDDALKAVLAAPIYRFHYKPNATMSTGDVQTEYVGVMAEEAPWAMHHNGTILNPVNTFGYTAGAIQALEARIVELEARVREVELAVLRPK